MQYLINGVKTFVFMIVLFVVIGAMTLLCFFFACAFTPWVLIVLVPVCIILFAALVDRLTDTRLV